MASSSGDVITELRTYVSRDAVHSGETFKAALRLMIGPEWHINANPASDEFLIPTGLEFSNDAPPFRVLDIIYPEAQMVRLGFSASDVAVYSENALIGALVKADASLKPGTYALEGKVTFQACNDVSCLPPESRDFVMTIVVVESERETRDINKDVFGAIKFRPDASLL